MDTLERPEDRSSAEESAIRSLPDRISDIISVNEKFQYDFYLLQWLTAQKLDPEKAETMIRKSLKWRQDMELDEAEDEEFLDFKSNYDFVYDIGKDGCLVGYIHIGRMDFKKGVSKYGKKRWLCHWSKLFKRMENITFAHNKERNKDAKGIIHERRTGFTLIIDINGFSASQLTNLDVLSSGIENVYALTHYFPALARLGIIINMNKVFKVVYSAIKPLLSLHYFTFEVYGSDESQWRDRILQNVDEAQLERFLQS